MSKPTVLFISKPFRCHEVARLHYNLLFCPVDFNCSPYEQADRLIEKFQKEGQVIDGIVAYLDAQVVLASILAERLGLVFPSPESVYKAQNKAVFAQELKKANLPCPSSREVTISEPLPSLDYPLFLKPAKGLLSAFSYQINSESELRKKQQDILQSEIISEEVYRSFFSQFDTKYTNLKQYFVAEELVKGRQFNIDGFVRKGEIISLGLTFAETTKDHKSFTRFDFPFKEDPELESRACAIASQVLNQLGFDNSGFNMEFFLKDNGEISVIEVNSRLSPGFFPLFEQRYQKTPVEMLCALAIGQKPDLTLKSNPLFASCFPLRVFQDYIVTEVPNKEQQRYLEQKLGIAEIDIWIKKGDQLSDYRQDAYSYRYGLICIGGTSFADIQATFRKFLEEVVIELAPLPSSTNQLSLLPKETSLPFYPA